MKKSLLDALTNFGNPIIKVADDNYKNRGELYLEHEWIAKDLEFEAALRTLRSLFQMWKRPVHLETREGGKPRLLSFDGEEAVMKELPGGVDEQEVVGTGNPDPD